MNIEPTYKYNEPDFNSEKTRLFNDTLNQVHTFAVYEMIIRDKFGRIIKIIKTGK